jgi:hypothetical protein
MCNGLEKPLSADRQMDRHDEINMPTYTFVAWGIIQKCCMHLNFARVAL